MTALSPPATGLLPANLACMLSMLVWAAGLPAADVLIGPVPPLPLTAARLMLAVAVLLPLWWALEGVQAMRAAPWGRGIVVGGLGFALGAFLIIVAQGRTDPVTVAVISATMPVVGIAFECLLDGRRLTRSLVAGLLLSMAGGLMAYAAAIGSLTLGLGAAAAFGSVLAFTWGSRATVTRFPGMTPLGRTTVTLTGATVVALVATAIHSATGGAGPDWAALGWREAGALAIFAIGGLALSQVLWILSVGRLGIGVASLHSNAAPFYVMLFIYALGGSWNGLQALGAVVVAAGVLLAQGLIPVPRWR